PPRTSRSAPPTPCSSRWRGRWGVCSWSSSPTRRPRGKADAQAIPRRRRGAAARLPADAALRAGADLRSAPDHRHDQRVAHALPRRDGAAPAALRIAGQRQRDELIDLATDQPNRATLEQQRWRDRGKGPDQYLACGGARGPAGRLERLHAEGVLGHARWWELTPCAPELGDHGAHRHDRDSLLVGGGERLHRGTRPLGELDLADRRRLAGTLA